MGVKEETDIKHSFSFGVELKRWRKEKDISQKDLAEKITTDPTYISRLERRARAEPDLFHKLSKALGLTDVEKMEFELRSGFVPVELRGLLGDPEVVEIIGEFGSKTLSEEERKILLEDIKAAFKVVARIIKKYKPVFNSSSED